MSLFTKLFKVAAAFILFPVAVFFSIYTLEQQGFFKIDKVEIRIDTKTSQKNYISSKIKELQIKLNSIKGISLWRAPLSQISQSLKEEKWIKNFQITRAWPSGVILTVEPDNVVILVMSQEGIQVGSEATLIRPITESGQLLGKINSNSSPNAMVTHDSVFLSDQQVRDGAMEIIKSLPETGAMSSAHVSEIGFDKKEGYWIKLLKSDTKINFGELQFEIKSARISQVIEYLESRNLKARVIDANLSKKVLVRLQQNP